MVTLPDWEPRATVAGVASLHISLLPGETGESGGSWPRQARVPNLDGALCLGNGNSRECDS